MFSFITNTSVITILAVFGIAVLTSLDAIVLNEEALVALCFILFIIFTYLNVKDLIVSEFHNRAAQIQKEFDDAYQLKERIFESLITQHQKQVSLLHEMDLLFSFSKEQILTLIQTRQNALHQKIVLDIDEKLKMIAMKEQALLRYIQLETNKYIVQQILKEALLASTPSGLDTNRRAIKEGIELLYKLGKKK